MMGSKRMILNYFVLYFRFDSSLVDQDEAARKVLEQAMRIQSRRA